MFYITQEHKIVLSWPIWDDAALCVQTLGFMLTLLGTNEVHALYDYSCGLYVNDVRIRASQIQIRIQAA